MDADATFEDIRKLISEGQSEEAVKMVRQLAKEADDPLVSIKCLSLLKVINDAEASREIIDSLMCSLPSEKELLIQIAGALRGLDFPNYAYSILKGMDQEDSVLTLTCLCLEDMEEYEVAYDTIITIKDPQPFDKVMKSEILSALGRHKESVENAELILAEMPDDFDVRRAYVSSLILAGNDKQAVKYVRDCLKDKSSESNALAAYVMRITGNTKAAAGYATRAIKIDSTNVSAMETLGICLAEKGEYDKARIVAGAINEVSPGSRAALNVLSYCNN